MDRLRTACSGRCCGSSMSSSGRATRLSGIRSWCHSWQNGWKPRPLPSRGVQGETPVRRQARGLHKHELLLARVWSLQLAGGWYRRSHPI